MARVGISKLKRHLQAIIGQTNDQTKVRRLKRWYVGVKYESKSTNQCLATGLTLQNRDVPSVLLCIEEKQWVNMVFWSTELVSFV